MISNELFGDILIQGAERTGLKIGIISNVNEEVYKIIASVIKVMLQNLVPIIVLRLVSNLNWLRPIILRSFEITEQSIMRMSKILPQC